jgi:acyl-ACP thioesterase
MCVDLSLSFSLSLYLSLSLTNYLFIFLDHRLLLHPNNHLNTMFYQDVVTKKIEEEILKKRDKSDTELCYKAE